MEEPRHLKIAFLISQVPESLRIYHFLFNLIKTIKMKGGEDQMEKQMLKVARVNAVL